jgi:hypothetical protein
VRQYASAFTKAYDKQLRGMVERRMQQSIISVASFWFTAWVDAGQPDLSALIGTSFTPIEIQEFDALNQAWRAGTIKGRAHE